MILPIMKNKFSIAITAAFLITEMLSATGCSPSSDNEPPVFSDNKYVVTVYEKTEANEETSSSESLSEPDTWSESDETSPADSETENHDNTVFSEETTESGDTSAAQTVSPADNETQAPTETPNTENNAAEPFASRLEDYTEKWYYKLLGQQQRTVYQRMFDALSNDQTEFNVKDLNLSDNEYIEVMEIFRLDNPQFFTVSYNGSLFGDPQTRKATKIKLERTRQLNEIPFDEFKEKVQSVLAEAKTIDNHYDRIKYIHDLIINETVYVDSEEYPYISKADGPLVYGEALCEGYSAAFMYIAQSLGYECICVYGTAVNSHGESSDHMWNMIKIGEEWYHIDVTWDDPVSSDGNPKLRHKYFLISEEAISENHTIEMWAEYPTAENKLNMEAD